MLDGSLGGHIHVEMKFGDDVWPVEVDAGEMELAVLNLCLNARDAMAGGRHDHHRRGQRAGVEDERRVAADVVKLSVTDTGCGMPPEVMARAFEPFFTTKDVNKGSGLGLPQVYGFAQQSGGQVTIDSEVGVGTIVTLLLPALLAAIQPGRRRAADAPGVPVPAATARAAATCCWSKTTRKSSALTREMLSSLGFAVTHVAECRSRARRARQRARCRRRAVRHHDAGRRQRPRPGARDPAPAPDLPIILTTGYVGSRRANGRRRVPAAAEALQPRSAGGCARRRSDVVFRLVSRP